MRKRGLGLIGTTFVLILFTRGAAAAETSDAAAAQALFDEGKALMAAGKPAEACPKFAASQRLDPGVGTLLNLAACYETSGQSASAWSTFLEAESAARAAGNAEGVRVAAARAKALVPNLVKLRVVVRGTPPQDLEIRRDDRVVSREQWGLDVPVDPGKHVIVASASGREPFRTELDLTSPGKASELEIPELAVAKAQTPVAAATAAASPNSQSKPAEPPPAQSGMTTGRWLGVGAGAVGVVGVVVGSIFGLKSISKHNEADEHCDGANCRDETGVELRADARQFGNISTVGFIVGGVGLAAGTVLWLSSGPKAGQASTALVINPTGLSVRSRF